MADRRDSLKDAVRKLAFRTSVDLATSHCFAPACVRSVSDHWLCRFGKRRTFQAAASERSGFKSGRVSNRVRACRMATTPL